MTIIEKISDSLLKYFLDKGTAPEWCYTSFETYKDIENELGAKHFYTASFTYSGQSALILNSVGGQTKIVPSKLITEDVAYFVGEYEDLEKLKHNQEFNEKFWNED